METFDKYIGQVFDRRYRIDKIVGVGGMAVVFEAEDMLMNRTVAVKMLKEEINDDAQSVKRFINESRAVAMLNHENIVSIYDVSVKDDIKYIVMEYVRGITLKNYMNRKGVIAWKEALSYTSQILAALIHAHEKGIIHRDIKPQNILLLKNGLIKVTDFGIAKLPNTDTVTMTDKAIGTVYYISPEQASGKAIDNRSDLYSLGAMLYEMVTGQLPFEAETTVSVALMQINDDPVPPCELMPNLPRGLEQIILCAMDKDPAYRYQSAEQMRKAVDMLRVRPGTVFPSRRPEGQTPSGRQKDTKNGTAAKGTGKGNGKKKRKKRRGSRSMLPVIAGVAMAFMICGGVAMVYILSELVIAQQTDDYETIEVEQFVGQKYTDVLKTQMKNGKYYEITVENVYSADVPENEIISQEPEAGTHKKVSMAKEQMCQITLTVSLGRETFEMPDMTLSEYRQVELTLARLGLKYEVVEDYHDTVLEGYVYATEPAAGVKVTSGDTVILHVSRGQKIEYVTVPNFLGLSKEEAMKLLVESELALGRVTFVASDRPAGEILSQSKPEFASVPKSATKIDFTISGGPDYGTEETQTPETETAEE